jgi:uncharacterized protein (DUF2267 family)
MTTRPDPTTPEAPQKATDGRQSAPEAPNGQRETPRGQNEAQEGAQRLDSEPHPRGPVDRARRYANQREQQPAAGDLQQRIAQAVRDTPARYPDDIAAAVWRVVGREIERMKLLVAASESDAHAVRMAAQYADKAIENGERAARLAATLDELLRQFVHKGHPGEPCLQTGWISEKTVARWRAVLYPQAAHDVGPSVAECAQADRRWSLEKHGE